MEQLSIRERQAVVLKETGHAVPEIARRLGVSANTVATLLARARAKGYQVVVVLPGDALGIPPDMETAEAEQEGVDEVEGAGGSGREGSGGDAVR